VIVTVSWDQRQVDELSSRRGKSRSLFMVHGFVGYARLYVINMGKVCFPGIADGLVLRIYLNKALLALYIERLDKN
jgi:hypothetical protein